MRILVAFVAVAFASAPALSRPSPAEYAAVEVALPAGAALPRDAVVQDENGGPLRLDALVTRPTVLVFADYACRTLCGPVIAFVAAALQQSGLEPDAQFRLVVIGLNARETAADAAEMRRRNLGDDAALNSASRFVTASEPTVQALTTALGYHFLYDRESGQYVHPAAAFVLSADGRVVRVLTGIGLAGEDMRLALIEASEGKAGTAADRVRLLCSAFDPAQGAYNLVISRILAAAGLATVVVMAAGIGFLALSGRRAA